MQPSPKKSMSRRRRLFWWALFSGVGLGALVVALVVFMVAIYPNRVTVELLKRSGLGGGVEKVSWSGLRRLEFHNVLFTDPVVGDYFRVDTMSVEWSWWDLVFHQKLSLVDIEGPRLWTGRTATAMSKRAGPAPEEPLVANPPPVAEKAIASSSFAGLTIGTLRIGRGTIYLDGLGYGLPSVPVKIGRAGQPLEFKNLYFGGRGFMQSDETEQTARAENILITSAYDAISPVLSFGAIEVKFTWNGILRNELIALTIENPVLYLGPDLFWFYDEIKKERGVGATRKKKPAPWAVKAFAVKDGEFIVTAFGQPNVKLPIKFATEASNLRLDNLESLNLKNQIRIERQDKDYDEYGIRLRGFDGNINFSWPPTDDKANNVVGTINVDELFWHELKAEKMWVSVTFDRKGIYGKFGSNTYKGYTEGGFSFLIENGFPWEAWLSLTDVDVQPLTLATAKDHFLLTGKTTGVVRVKAKTRDVSKLESEWKLSQPGVLKINSVSALLEKLPPEWSDLKKTLAKIVITPFIEYPYTSGQATIYYAKPTSTAKVELLSPNGNRKFEVNWSQTTQGPDEKAPVVELREKPIAINAGSETKAPALPVRKPKR